MSHLGRTLKTLKRSPGFTGVVILTLAVGIGANTVVFSVVDGTVLLPGVAVAASLLPAGKAASMDPVEALRDR